MPNRDQIELSRYRLEKAGEMIDDAFSDGDYEGAYKKIRKNEKQAKEILIDFDQAHQGAMKGENINVILERVRRKRKKDDMER